MKRFDTFSTDGYDVVATAKVFEGGGPWTEAVVYCNFSNVYIVAVRLDAESLTAEVREFFGYGDSPTDTLRAYRAALRDMVNVALTL